MELSKFIKPFHATNIFLYPLKISERLLGDLEGDSGMKWVNKLEREFSQLTGLIANLWENKICTAIYHASVNIWCNLAYLLAFLTFMALANWKWSKKWYTFCSCYSSPDWEARSIKISHTWKTSKLKKHTSIQEKFKRKLAMARCFLECSRIALSYIFFLFKQNFFLRNAYVYNERVALAWLRSILKNITVTYINSPQKY